MRSISCDICVTNNPNDVNDNNKTILSGDKNYLDWFKYLLSITNIIDISNFCKTNLFISQNMYWYAINYLILD